MAGRYFIGVDVIETLTGVSVLVDGVTTYLNAATVAYTLKTVDGAIIPGGSGTYTYVAGSDGDYTATIDAAITALLSPGVLYKLHVTVTEGSYDDARILDRFAEYRGSATSVSFTSEGEITAFSGQIAANLRTDDVEFGDLVGDAVEWATGEILFAAQSKWLAADLAAVPWVRNVGTAFALEWLCLRRLNAVPASLAKLCERYREKLDQIQVGQAIIPGAPRSRRPIAVSNLTVDLRRFNNQTRVDKPRSTGVVTGYHQQTDPTAPNER